MTIEAQMAKDAAYDLECKKDGLLQKQDGCIKITFTVNPLDMVSELYADPMGQRYRMFLVPIDDNEQPKISTGNASPAAAPEGTEFVPSPPAPKPIGQRAKALANLREFQAYLAPDHPATALEAVDFIRECCGVESCADIEKSAYAKDQFTKLENTFHNWSKEKARGRL